MKCHSRPASGARLMSRRSRAARVPARCCAEAARHGRSRDEMSESTCICTNFLNLSGIKSNHKNSVPKTRVTIFLLHCTIRIC